MAITPPDRPLEDDFQPSPEWDDELKRRTREINEGRAKMVPAAEVWRVINRDFGTDF
jgi:hypothetical protein